MLVLPVDDRLNENLSEVIAGHGAWLQALEVMPEHVHLVIEVDPPCGVHRLVKAMKGRSSRLQRQEFPQLRSRLPTLSTNSYFVATTGGAPPAVIKQYVENQRHV